MTCLPARGNAVEPLWTLDRSPFECPAGLRILVPGWPQLAWGQRQRGVVLSVSFASAVGIGFAAWGTWIGLVCFVFAFVCHNTSATDALRQGWFPAYPRRTAMIVTAGTFGALIYLPALVVSFLTAWPGFSTDRSGSGYLVNCWAYHGSGPRQGHLVWLRLPQRKRPHAARVIAVSGQEVEWDGHYWRVDGQDRPLQAFLRSVDRPQACRFKVPKDHILVEPEDDGVSPPATSPLVLVSQDRIIGRAWAQYYPVWERRFL